MRTPRDGRFISCLRPYWPVPHWRRNLRNLPSRPMTSTAATCASARAASRMRRFTPASGMRANIPIGRTTKSSFPSKRIMTFPFCIRRQPHGPWIFSSTGSRSIPGWPASRAVGTPITPSGKSSVRCILLRANTRSPCNAKTVCRISARGASSRRWRFRQDGS